MIEKIKNFLTLRLRNKKINIEFSYLELLMIILVFTSFFDAITTYLVLENWGIELNPYMQGLYDKGVFVFLYSKIFVYPLVFMYISIVLSNIYFYIFKNDNEADNFLIISILIFSWFYFIAWIVNLINYLILIV